jgi:hypothetical protein
MDMYDLEFLFGAVLALSGAIILSASTNTFSTWTYGMPLLIFGIIIMLVGIFSKALAKPRVKE